MSEEIKQKWKSDLHKLIRVKLWLNEPVQIEMEKFVEDLLSQALQKRDEEIKKKLSGHIMSRVDFGCFSAKVNNWDVDQREDYARKMEKEILSILTTK